MNKRPSCTQLEHSSGTNPTWFEGTVGGRRTELREITIRGKFIRENNRWKFRESWKWWKVTVLAESFTHVRAATSTFRWLWIGLRRPEKNYVSVSGPIIEGHVLYCENKADGKHIYIQIVSSLCTRQQCEVVQRIKEFRPNWEHLSKTGIR